jgi:hypothetical protein
MDINIGPLVLTVKEAFGVVGVIFMAGGIWREALLIKAEQKETKEILRRHGKYLVNDRDVLQKIVTEHNMHHDSNIQVPNANGMASSHS